MRCQGPRAFRLDAYSDDSWYTRTDGRKDIVLDRSSERALARAAHDPSPEADPDPPPEANPALGAPAASPAPATEVSPANEIATTHPAPAAPARRPGVTLLVRVAAEPPPSEEDAVYLAIEPRPLPDDPPESNLYELRRSGSLRGPGDGRIEDVRPGPALLLVDRDIGPHGERTHFFALALTVPEGGGALDVALPALAPLTVEIGRGRRGRLRAWLLDGPEPFEVVLDPRGFEGTLSLPHVPPGRWLFTLEPDPPEDAALPTSGRGALPHLERRVTLPGTSLVRFEPP